ncbi:hypothetical protein LIER_09055 [Lithospermum erythrorhizon]|uniref:Crossover junction endonuclease MUS81 n=1 Tax=Lithospermum erythrorhizon TaxID=34254 RepID=A0AAV3PJ31_LITER
MDRRRRRAIVCSENEELADFLWVKREELAQSPKGISDNLDTTLYNGYCNVCVCKTPIKTIKEFSQLKGIGKWIIKQSQGFFDTGLGASEDEDVAKKGKRGKSTRRYVPQKNSVAYALLITLYRKVRSGTEFMHKQELIDVAETSGLSRVPIGPEKGKGKPRDFGSSPRDWYSGWNCMKTLITKGLVAKSSCPAKYGFLSDFYEPYLRYMLTEEGKEAARECIFRSGLSDADEILAPNDQSSNLKQHDLPDPKQSGKDLLESEFPAPSLKKVHPVSVQFTKQKKSVEPPSEFLNKFLHMGFSKEEVGRVFSEVSETSQGKDIASLWPTVLCRLRENQVYGKEDIPASKKPQRDAAGIVCSENSKSSDLNTFNQEVPTLGPRRCAGLEISSFKPYSLAVPPLDVGERFEEAYKVILLLDDREHFASRGSRASKLIDNIRAQFEIEVEVRRLPVGDGIWIAQHKQFGSEYVLDFIVERKKVDDLRSSIRDNRYKDQKLRLMRCGLKKMIYLVEGDPNASEAAESIKTACFTTEILEGFDVQRTTGLGDTLRKYGHLTQSIKKYYRSLDPEHNSSVCAPYKDFVKRCQDMEMLTVSDVFAIQLMQVPQVTEEIALAVVDLYPTLLSLARAYSLLDGDTHAQAEMLKKQSNNLINGAASRNIFQLVWGN